MFLDWLFKQRKTSTRPKLGPFYFKDSKSAFEMACKYLKTSLQEGVILAALVEDPRSMEELALNSVPAVRRDEKGRQVALLRVSSPDGGFLTVAVTPGNSGPELFPGNLVAWMACGQVNFKPENLKDSPSQALWAGLIVAKLKPEYKEDSWIVEEYFKN